MADDRWPIRSCISAHFSKFLLYQDVLLNDIFQFVIFDTQNIEKHVLMQADVLKGINCQQLNVQHKWSATVGHCLF